MGAIEDGVRADLTRWQVPAESGLAASAVDMARRLDAPGMKPAAAAQMHGQLREVLTLLAKQAPEEQESDGLDELQRRRAERRSA